MAGPDPRSHAKPFRPPWAEKGSLCDPGAAANGLPREFAQSIRATLDNPRRYRAITPVNGAVTTEGFSKSKCRGFDRDRRLEATVVPPSLPLLLSVGYLCSTLGFGGFWVPKAQPCIITPAPGRGAVLPEVSMGAPRLDLPVYLGVGLSRARFVANNGSRHRLRDCAWRSSCIDILRGSSRL